MPDWDATDAAVIAVMGETVTYAPNGGASVAIKAFFQAPDVEVDTQDIAFESLGPMLTCLKADVPGPSHADRFTVRGLQYGVKRIERDESGMVICHLLLAGQGGFDSGFSGGFE